jgi:hypothetical protein
MNPKGAGFKRQSHEVKFNDLNTILVSTDVTLQKFTVRPPTTRKLVIMVGKAKQFDPQI